VQIADAQGLIQFGNDGPCLVCSDEFSFFSLSALKANSIKKAPRSFPSWIPGYAMKKISCMCEDRDKVELVRL
jgi:hypothetical protein